MIPLILISCSETNGSFEKDKHTFKDKEEVRDTLFSSYSVNKAFQWGPINPVKGESFNVVNENWGVKVIKSETDSELRLIDPFNNMVHYQKKDTMGNILIDNGQYFSYWYLYMNRPDHSVDIIVSSIPSDTAYRNLGIFMANPDNISELEHIKSVFIENNKDTFNIPLKDTSDMYMLTPSLIYIYDDSIIKRIDGSYFQVTLNKTEYNSK